MAYSVTSLFVAFVLFLSLQFPHGVSAGVEETIVGFKPSDGAVEIQYAVVIHDDHDPIGISIAVNNLADDFAQITGRKPLITAWKGANHTRYAAGNSSDVAIIAATVDSPLIRQLESAGKLETGDIRGKWETFRTTLVEDLLPGVQNAFVIAGSDMRGVIFGIYTLSEQCGQSP